MNYRAWKEDTPIVVPMYYDYPETVFWGKNQAPNQYFFGSELMVTPETKCQRLFSTHTFHCMKKATVDFSTMAIKSFLFTFDFRQPHAQTGIGLTL